MRQTLFSIPLEIAGWPLFGFGILLGLWLLLAVCVIGRSAWRRGLRGETLGYLPVFALGGVIIAFVLPALLDDTGLPIRGYGVMLLVAVSAAVALCAYRARQVGLDPEIIFSLAFWLFISGIVGARLFYVVEYWEPSFHKATLKETVLAIINVPQGGLVVYGSLIAGGIALVAFVYKHRLPGPALADLIVPGVVLGMALGRVGCFLNGCCYGGACDLPWSVTFPVGSAPHDEQAQRGQLFIHGLKLQGAPTDPPVIAEVEPGSSAEQQGLKPGDEIATIETTVRSPGESEPSDQQVKVHSVAEARTLLLRRFHVGQRISLVTTADPNGIKQWTITPPLPRSRPVHPTQIYSTIDSLLLCLFLLAYTPFRRREGELTALTLTIHPISRFLIEIIRIDESSVFGTGLSISQNVSLILLAGAAVFWIYLLRRPLGLATLSRMTSPIRG